MEKKNNNLIHLDVDIHVKRTHPYIIHIEPVAMIGLVTNVKGKVNLDGWWYMYARALSFKC